MKLGFEWCVNSDPRNKRIRLTDCYPLRSKFKKFGMIIEEDDEIDVDKTLDWIRRNGTVISTNYQLVDKDIWISFCLTPEAEKVLTSKYPNIPNKSVIWM